MKGWTMKMTFLQNRKTLLTAVLLTAMTSIACGINIPTPLTVGIDDLGWKQGWSTDVTDDNDKPWHIDMQQGRMMGLEDYEALVYIGKAVNTRLQCLFIMSEFDRSNICAEYPTTTEQGSKWDNSALVSDDDFKIMDYVKANAANMEFALHGVRHEYWKDGAKIRAEFNGYGHKPWPYSDVQGHMECFKRLIDQYGISFPKSFVPPANGYYYNLSDPKDTGGLAASWGVKYAARSGRQLKESGMDNGLLVLRRYQSIPWKGSQGVAPDDVIEDFYYEGTHWHNYLEKDPARNHEAGDRWIKWFNRIKDRPHRYVPKNTAQLFSQALYLKYTKKQIINNAVNIDNTEMPDWAYEKGLLGNLTFKIAIKPGTHINSSAIDGENIACYYEDQGYGYIVLPRLDKAKYVLTFFAGPTFMPNYVLNDGTYNVKKFETAEDSAKVSLEMYGTQDVKVILDGFVPKEVKSSNEALVVNSSKWDSKAKMFTVNVTAKDIQGVEGDLVIK